MDSAEILVTGATGNVGAEVLKQLREAGFSAIAAGRSGEGRLSRRLDFEDASTFGQAFGGIKKVFLVRPPAVSNVKKYMFPAIDAAVKAGVGHFVLLSLQGAEKNNFVPHHTLEQYLTKQKAAWTFLRPSFFMQNLSTTHREEIRQKSEIFVPAGNGRTNFIDAGDIALAAVKTLTEPGHENKAYEITGSESLTYLEIADILSETLGRKITYKNPGPIAFFARKLSEKQPLLYAFVTTALYTASAAGLAAGMSPDFVNLTKKNPKLFRQFVLENRDLWI